MVLDTSALVAILQREPERRAFVEAIEAADVRLLSVATFVEISSVIEARHGAEGTASRRLELRRLLLVRTGDLDGRTAPLQRGGFRVYRRHDGGGGVAVISSGRRVVARLSRRDAAIAP